MLLRDVDVLTFILEDDRDKRLPDFDMVGG